MINFIKNCMISSGDTIFRFFFIFLDEKVVEKKFITDTIFSQSFTYQNDDVFCAYNAGRLYQIIENTQKKFQIKNEIIPDKLHRNIITTLLAKMNEETPEYQIKTTSISSSQKKYHEMIQPLKMIFVKILNFDIEKSIYLKLETNLQFRSSKLILSEKEAAKIIFSHLFSYINDHVIFLCKMMNLFASDRFNLKDFHAQLYDLEQKIDHTDYFFNIYEQKEQKNFNIEKWHEYSHLPISFRNLMNFFYMFSQNYFFIVNDDEEKNIMQFYINKNALIPFRIHYRNFLKILFHFDLPCSVIFVEKHNFTVLNFLIEKIFFLNCTEKIVLNFTYLLEYDLRDFLLKNVNNSKSISIFLKKLIENDDKIIQIGNLQFEFNLDTQNFTLIKSSLSKSTVNNFHLLTCIDFYTSKNYQKFPHILRLLIDVFVQITMDNMKNYGFCSKIHIIEKKRTIVSEFKYKMIQKMGIEVDSILSERFNLNAFLKEYKVENNQEKKNFFFIRKIENLKIFNFEFDDFLAEKTFLAGKFEGIYIRTNKIVDLHIDKFFISFVIYKNDPLDECLFSNIVEMKYSNNDYSMNNCNEMSLINDCFRVFFFDFMKIISLNLISSFYYLKNDDQYQILNIHDCSVSFSSVIPSVFRSISITRSEIVLSQEKTEFLSLNNCFVKLNIKQSIFCLSPSFNIFKCDFYIFRNTGNFQCSFDNQSFVRIYEHNGRVLINKRFFIHFESKTSFFYFKLNQRIIPEGPIHLQNRAQFNFVQVTFLDDVVIEMKQVHNFRLKKCKFKEKCKFYIQDSMDGTMIDLFQEQDHLNDYFLFFIDIETVQKNLVVNFYI